MAEVSRKRRGELVRGVFKILIPKPDGLPAKQVLEQLESVVPPTEFEKSTYPKWPNIRRYEKIARFSTIGPVKAGWLQKNKGLWAVTDQGRAAVEKHKDPVEFAHESDRLYRQWAAQQPETSTETEGTESPGAESPEASTTLEEAEEASWTEVEEHLKVMSPYDFQNLVAGLLKGMGYHVAWVAPPGPDRGVDIIADTTLWASVVFESKFKLNGPMAVSRSRIYAPFLQYCPTATWDCLWRSVVLLRKPRTRPVTRRSGASCYLISSDCSISGWSITKRFPTLSVGCCL
jgi:hypothetical protein